VIALGEVLWDVFEDGRRLGGAPLNFAVHYRRLGHPAALISALGDDEPGSEAAKLIAGFDIDTRFLQTRPGYPTGSAGVTLGPDDSQRFDIARPAAYDDLRFTTDMLQKLRQSAPAWIYYGTLFATTAQGRRLLDRLLDAVDDSLRFLDLNLRPDTDIAGLALDLLARSDVVKLNEEELGHVQALTDLTGPVSEFCERAAGHFGWQAVAVTLGSRGCAIWANGSYAEAPAHPISVVDTVGAGDAFSAAFMHGLSQRWPPERIAHFANRRAAEVAGQAGALPGSCQ
jgi:fructokinase